MQKDYMHLHYSHVTNSSTANIYLKLLSITLACSISSSYQRTILHAYLLVHPACRLTSLTWVFSDPRRGLESTINLFEVQTLAASSATSPSSPLRPSTPLLSSLILSSATSYRLIRRYHIVRYLSGLNVSVVHKPSEPTTEDDRPNHEDCDDPSRQSIMIFNIIIIDRWRRVRAFLIKPDERDWSAGVDIVRTIGISGVLIWCYPSVVGRKDDGHCLNRNCCYNHNDNEDSGREHYFGAQVGSVSGLFSCRGFLI